LSLPDLPVLQLPRAGLGLRHAKEKPRRKAGAKKIRGIWDRLLPTSGGPEMSIRITSTAEWFRCMGPTATSEEQNAALERLIRMLAGDTNRPRPPISLAGRPTIPTPPPPSLAPAPVPVTHPRPLGRTPREKAVEPSSDDADACEPYSREQLVDMDMRFVKRLERAIARGKERPPCSTI
jgi:hypothetical protein